MNNPRFVIVEEYRPELDVFGDKVKTMQYPAMIIFHDSGALLFDFNDMDIMFNRYMASVAKKKFNKKDK